MYKKHFKIYIFLNVVFFLKKGTVKKILAQ